MKAFLETKKKPLLVLLTTLAIVLLGGLVFYALYFTNLFVLKDIKIYGNSKISREEVLKLLDLRGGEILYRLDLAKIREKIKRHHLIEDVQVRREFLSGLEVRIKERSPLAILVKNNRGYLIDRHGVILTAISPDDIFYYPFVFMEEERNKDVFLSFLAWLKDNKNYLPVYENLQKIHLTKDRIVIHTKSKITIYLPLTTSNELFTLYSFLDRIMNYIYDNKLEDKVELIRLDYPFGKALLRRRS